MSVHLKGDVEALRASNQRLANTIGDKRFRAAQAALAGESSGAPKLATSVQAVAPETANADGLNARERADLTFLKKAGVVPHGSAADARSVAADDASGILALVRAAGLPGFKGEGA